MNRPSSRSKWIAIATGAISLILGIVYLVVVQLLDLRGEMVPAPVSDLSLGRSLLDGRLGQCVVSVLSLTFTF